MRGDRELSSLQQVSKLLYQQLGECTITETQDQMAHYDLGVNYKNQYVYVEVKERMGKYVQLSNFINFSEEGWLCENVKWDFLNGKLSRYINLFRVEGEIIIMTWDLNKLVKQQTSLNCPSTTEFENNNYRNKPSMLLTPEQGTTYIYNLEEDRYDVIKWNDLKLKL